MGTLNPFGYDTTTGQARALGPNDVLLGQPFMISGTNIFAVSTTPTTFFPFGTAISASAPGAGTIATPAASGSNNAGGSLNVSLGAGNGSGAGGSFVLTSGPSLGSGASGSIGLATGGATSTGPSGDVYINTSGGFSFGTGGGTNMRYAAVGKSKTLTNSTAVGIVSLGTGGGGSGALFTGGVSIFYSISTQAGTDVATERGVVHIAMANKAGTTTTNIVDTTAAKITTGGATLSHTFTAVDIIGAINVEISATSSLTTTMSVTYTILSDNCNSYAPL